VQGDVPEPLAFAQQSFVLGFERSAERRRNDVADQPMHGVVVRAVDERLARPQMGGGVDRNHDRPLETFGAMDGDQLDGVAFGVDPALVKRRAQTPVAAEIAHEVLQSLDVVRSGPFQNGLDVVFRGRA